MADEPKLPTYKTAAQVLERDKGSGIRLAGWTVARTILIAPAYMIVGCSAKQAFAGAAIASLFISGLTLIRVFDARTTGLAGIKGAKCLSKARTSHAAARCRARARR